MILSVPRKVVGNDNTIATVEYRQLESSQTLKMATSQRSCLAK